MNNPPIEPFYSYVIYDKPTDYPDKFVVRRFNWDQPQKIIGTALTLANARMYLPQGLAFMGRQPDDDPKIVEVWI